MPLFARAVPLLIAMAACGCEPAPQRAPVTPTADVAAGPATGAELFDAYCASCHGVHQANLGPALAVAAQEFSAEQVLAFVQDPQAHPLRDRPVVGMPAFGYLPVETLEAIWAHVRTVAAEPVPLAACDAEPEVERAFVEDPIPEPIADAPFALVVEPWAQVPASSDEPPAARINMLKAAPDGRLFVNDLRGRLYRLDGGEPAVYLDLKAQRPDFFDAQGLGSGFGAFAFHPAFLENGRFYTTHVETAGAAPATFAYAADLPVAIQWVLTEWRTPAPTTDAFTGTSRELLRIDVPSFVHGAQDVAFRPGAAPGDDDFGLLYVLVGDGGATIEGHPGLVRRLDTGLGKVLRIDPLGGGPGEAYGIPPDNPLVGRPGARPEVWAWGFRNPHRAAWDDEGHLLVPDVGERNVEELNVVAAGGDYGWNVREGSFAIDPCVRRPYARPADDGGLGFRYAAARYDHDEGRAIGGGHVYRGDALPALRGQYLFSDIPSGQVFTVEADALAPAAAAGTHVPIRRVAVWVAGASEELKDLVGGRVDLHVGTDADGELYLLTKRDGRVWRVTATAERE